MQCYVQATCATQGTDLNEGLDWLSKEYENYQTIKNEELLNALKH